MTKLKLRYYAVKAGRRSGIFDSWKECEMQVKGYPNALYKAFESKESALEYLENKTPQKDDYNNKVDIQLYTDGSFSEKKQQYGWAYVAVKENKTLYVKYGHGANDKYLDSKQVGGEIVAVLQGIDYAIYKGYKHAEICYDFAGVENWITGMWKANSKIAEAYRYLVDIKKNKIEISFKKIKAHTDEQFNGMADRLARKGANS